MTNRREPAFDWVDILSQHISIDMGFDDDPICDCAIDTIDWFTTGDLVALATQIDAELQRRAAEAARTEEAGFYQDDEGRLWPRRGYNEREDD